MICKKCNSKIYKDSLCNRHYYRDRWLNNSDKDNLGIIHFAKSIVPNWVRDETAGFQKEELWNFFQLYRKDKSNKYDRLLAQIAFRGAAKSTWSKIKLLYICCYGLEKVIAYCSETNAFAVNDIFDVRREITSNPRIRYYFGVISSKAVQGLDGEWRKDAYRTTTGVYVIARGVEQQIRSLLKDGYRTTLAIITDMYSKNNTLTEGGRKKAAEWFFNDLMNGVDDIEGKMFFCGTILHEDTVPVTLERNPAWKVLKCPIMSIDNFYEALKKCTIDEYAVHLPSDKDIKEMEDRFELAWKDRLGLKYILLKYQEAYQSKQIPSFYQEYFHLVISQEERCLKPIKKAQMDYFRFRSRNWLKVKIGDTEVVYPVNIFFGVDPASSLTSSAKYTVISVIAMNQYRQIFVYYYSRGKYGLRDRFTENNSRNDTGLVCSDVSGVSCRGIVDEEIRLAKQFFPSGSQIETTQAQEHIYTEIIRLMGINNANHMVLSCKPMTNKEDRDADMLAPYFQTGSFYINYNMPDLENELGSFPRGQTIDIIDSLYHAVAIARPSENLDYEEFKTTKRKKQEFETDFHALI
jgi:hypothetical protein